MKIGEEKQNGVVVLAPEGRLDATESPILEGRITELIAGGDTRVLVDLAAVSYVSSRGLRVFLLGAKQAAAAGGSLAVCSLQEFVAKVFAVVGFGDLIGVHADRESALASFGEQSC